ncbi:MFS transporter [Rhodopirellula baltica]|uniref:L-fucose:H+ symporter permease n=1 Tax=Rhodopirellula baltica SWK14 TaxID=993516 RepID=L7CGL0_RHOBT|nr:MFS transporter [Rhodopirellula baltica]ELP32757.1 L-fucose:H+ symporter permease [Rhodopirellula baltica SWK14]
MNSESETSQTEDTSSPSVVPREYLVPFILVTTLFALWGFANNFTDPMVKVFKDVFAISNAQSSIVQMAFYGGYATMAIPAAVFIRKYSYKSGILVGLTLFATGALLSIPAAANINFWLFIFGIYILTFGLAFLETTANPFILSMGPEETSTMRLNLAQAFNPIGSLGGAFIAASFVLTNVYVADFKADVTGFKQQATEDQVTQEELIVLPFLKAKDRELNQDPNVQAYVESVGAENVTLDQALVDFREGKIDSYQGNDFATIQRHDLNLVSTTYMTLGFIVIATLVVFLIKKMPDSDEGDGENDHELHLKATASRLLSNPRYVGGVIAQMFYVGAQIMVWTFILQYAEKELGMDNATAGNHQIAALVIFLLFRFVCTYFLRFVSPGKLLAVLAVGGMLTTLGAIHITGMSGLYSLMLISACMSLMFPTIYGIALEGSAKTPNWGPLD